MLFGYPVRDPERYGVGEMDATGTADLDRGEAGASRSRTWRSPGCTSTTTTCVEHAAGLQPSARGELEITDLNNIYVQQGKASLIDLGRGFAWLDTGTHDSLLEAGEFVQVLEHRQGVRISCLEEIALGHGFITAEQCLALGQALAKSPYGAVRDRRSRGPPAPRADAASADPSRPSMVSKECACPDVMTSTRWCWSAGRAPGCGR